MVRNRRRPAFLHPIPFMLADNPHPGKRLTGLILVLLFSGCTLAGPPPSDGRVPQALLSADLVQLLGYHDPESDRLARAVLARTAELAQAYQVQKPALWHNILVNMGLRERGLCCHWTRDLLQTIRALDLQKYRAAWAVSRHGTRREHNSVVILAPGKPFAGGLVLDPWRKAGDLYWAPVTTDVYPWQPHPADDGTARIGCR